MWPNYNSFWWSQPHPHPPPPSIPSVDCDIISPTQSPESSRAEWWRCGFCIKLFLTKNHFPRNVNCRKRRAAVHRHPGALAVTRPPWSLPSCSSQIVTTAWMQEFLHKESFSSYLQNTETKVWWKTNARDHKNFNIYFSPRLPAVWEAGSKCDWRLETQFNRRESNKQLAAQISCNACTWYLLDTV